MGTTTAGTLGSGNVINNGTIDFKRTNAYNVANTINGSGAVTITQTGGITFSGSAANTYTGTTSVNTNGTALILGKSANTNAIGGNLTVTANGGGAVVLWNASEQVPNTATINVTGVSGAGSATLNLNGFNETIAGLNIANNQSSNTQTLALGASTLTVNGNISISGGTSNAVNQLISATSGSLNLGGATRSISVSSTNPSIITAPIANGGVFKNGGGTLTLGGANTFTGGLTTNNGTVQLDFANAAAPTSDIVNSANAFSMTNSGNLTATGKASTANTQTFASTTIAGGGTITANNGAGGTMTVNLNALTRNNNLAGTVNFAGTGTIQTSNSLTNGIIGPWATFGNDYATLSSGNVVALNNNVNTSETGWTSATDNYTLTGVTPETLMGNRTANTLRIINNASTTIALGTNTLTTRGILFGGTGPHTISGTAGSGFLTIANNTLASGELVLAGTQSATISAPITGVGGRLTKTGTGAVTVTSTDPTYNGGIFIHGGSIVGGGGNSNNFGSNAVFVGTGTSFRPNTGAGGTVSYTREISGSGTINGAGSNASTAIHLTALRDAEFSGNHATGRGPSFNKYGPGTFTLSGTFVSTLGNNNSLSTVSNGELVIAGTSNVNNGTGAYVAAASGIYTLDHTAGNSNKFGDTTPLTLAGGGLKLIGNGSANTSETIGAVTFNSGLASNITVNRAGSQTATLTAASIARGGIAGILNINYNSAPGTNTSVISTAAITNVNDIVNGVLVNGTDFASTTGAAGAPILPLATYTNPSDINAVVATNNVLVNGTTTTSTLAGNAALNALKIDGNKTLDLASFDLEIGGSTLAAMIVKTGAGSATISGSAGSELHNIGATNMDYLVRVNQGDLTLTAAPRLTGSAGFNKSGPGLLVLAPNVVWNVFGSASTNDQIRVQEGAIRMDASDTTNFPLIRRTLQGGVFELTNDWTPTITATGPGLTWSSNADGGFAAFGGTRMFGTNLSWGTADHMNNGRALLLNSTTANAKIVMGGTLNLGTTANQMWFREIRVADNINSTDDYGEITGVISGGNQYHLLKTGAGRLDIGGGSPHTYAGETIIHAGRLNVNGTLAALTAPSHGQVSAWAGGTLGGNGIINRPVLIEAGGFIAPGNSIGQLTVNGNTTIAGTFEVEVDGDGVNPGLVDLLAVSGTLDISAATVDFAATSLNDTAYIFASYGSLVGSAFQTVDNLPSGYTIDYAYLGNNIALVVPEPCTWLLAGLGLAGLYVARRRRK